MLPFIEDYLLFSSFLRMVPIPLPRVKYDNLDSSHLTCPDRLGILLLISQQNWDFMILLIS
jgi:hypothetical protein